MVTFAIYIYICHGSALHCGRSVNATLTKNVFYTHKPNCLETSKAGCAMLCCLLFASNLEVWLVRRLTSQVSHDLSRKDVFHSKEGKPLGRAIVSLI